MLTTTRKVQSVRRSQALRAWAMNNPGPLSGDRARLCASSFDRASSTLEFEHATRWMQHILDVHAAKLDEWSIAYVAELVA